jgi:hypothetical protein
VDAFDAEVVAQVAPGGRVPGGRLCEWTTFAKFNAPSIAAEPFSTCAGCATEGRSTAQRDIGLSETLASFRRSSTAAPLKPDDVMCEVFMPCLPPFIDGGPIEAICSSNRAVQLRQWKRRRTIARRLIRLGIRRKTAWRSVYEKRKSIWAMSHMPAVDRALQNSHWEAQGLVSLQVQWRSKYQHIAAPVQLELALG